MAKKAAFKLTVKNIGTKAAQELTLNEIVFQLAPNHTNAEIIEGLSKGNREFSEASVKWYAAKSRSGVRR